MTLAADDLPLVSVLMPVRNESAFIDRSLGAVLGQDYPAHRLEVLVADGGSTDGTRETITKLQRRHASLRLIDNPERIVATGLNAAVREAKGEIIVRVDGHTIVERDYVRACVTALQESGADNVGGRMRADGQGPFGKAVAIATSTPFGVGGARFHYSDTQEWVDTVYLGAWKREVFMRVGLFDEELVRNQDDEFNYRIRALGGRILLSPRIRSTYAVRSTPGRLWKQYFEYGFWKVRVMQKHPRQMRPRQFVPAAFVALVVVGIGWACARPAAWPLAVLPVAAYLAADLAASAVAGRRAGGPERALLPLAFAILHVAYGSGFLTGLAVHGPRFVRAGGEKR